MTLKEYSERAFDYARKQGFWDVPKELFLLSKEANSFTLSKLMLIVTEVAEAAEAVRAGENKVENLKEELADILIRVFDLAGALGIDLDEAVERKMAENELRPYMHGKLS